MTNRNLFSLQRTLATFLFPMFLGMAAAAAETPTLTGIVTDPSGFSSCRCHGYPAHGASASLQTVATNDQGLYELVAPAGHYDLEITAPAFQPFRRTDLILGVEHPSRVDAQLSLESRAEVVTVVEEPFSTDPSSTQLGRDLTAGKISSVPLNGRNFANLLSLQPGIVPTSSAQPNAVVMSGVTSTPPSGDLDAGNLSVSGHRETMNGFAVNDSDVEEDVNMGAAVVPNLDSIQELRVFTGNFDAQYGNFSGGQVLVTTKSGSDSLNGSVFEFLRNTNLDAKSYFSADRAAFNRNQFGGTLGGPVRKQSVYFFADYQGTRLNEGIETGLIPVPSQRERAGDFSGEANSLTGAVGGPYLANQLSQKLGYAVNAGEPYYFSGCTLAS
jgi:hypothetical protein